MLSAKPRMDPAPLREAERWPRNVGTGDRENSQNQTQDPSTSLMTG